MPIANTTPFTISASVGKKAANKADDVAAVFQRLSAIRDTSVREGIPLRGISYPDTSGLRAHVPFSNELAGPPTVGFWNRDKPDYELKGAIDEGTIRWIMDFQSIFMKVPDGLIMPGGRTATFLANWSVKPVESDVRWHGQLKTAWLLVSPFLPEGSYCSSGYRTTEEQRALLVRFYTVGLAKVLKAKLGEQYDEILKLTGSARDVAMHREVNAAGQQIALPGRSLHESGRAFDVGGLQDAEQIRIAKLIGAANRSLLSGRVILERNSCVHVELV